MKGAPAVFDDALEIAQDALVSDIMGTDIEQQLEKREDADRKLLTLCQRIIAIDAFISCIPELDLILTDSGFGVVSNQDIAPASKERIKNLTDSLKVKLDDGKDRLVTFLLASEQYEGWRGSEEFARLSDGLIFTYSEFKDIAVNNNATVAVYPKSWTEFLRMNPALNVALTSDVAAYISPEYADELLEKVRDKEAMVPNEKKVLKMVKTAAAAIAMGDRETGVNQAIKATLFMKQFPADFPTYIGSRAAESLENKHSDTPIFSMF